MKTDVLKKNNLRAKSVRPKLSGEQVCDVFYDQTLVEICFLSGQCRNDRRGACIMCDYGAVSRTHGTEEYISYLDRIINTLTPEIKTLLLSTNGSFLDERQIPVDLLDAVIKRARTCAARTIEIEAHYMDVTARKLQWLRERLPGKNIMLEFGLETTNEGLQETIFQKGINLSRMEKTIRIAHDFGIAVECNIMVGLPFLSEREQFEDALASIKWVFAHQCTPVLFPVNIKPYTLLWDIYQAGYYEPVSQWMIPLILRELTEDQLGQVTVAWYGNREDIYTESDLRTVFPAVCDCCRNPIQEFYRYFLTAEQGAERDTLLEQLFSRASCACVEQLWHRIQRKETGNFEQRLTTYLRSSPPIGSQSKGGLTV